MKRNGEALVLVAPDATPTLLGFVCADGVEAIAAMARKLPHYSRFGRLVFDRASGENTFKDERTSDRSAVTRFLTADEVERAALPQVEDIIALTRQLVDGHV